MKLWGSEDWRVVVDTTLRGLAQEKAVLRAYAQSWVKVDNAVPGVELVMQDGLHTSSSAALQDHQDHLCR